MSSSALAFAHWGPLPRTGLLSPGPTLSRKRQGFSSINTSVGGELWGPQEPQGGLVSSKINLGADTSREKPRRMLEVPRQDPSGSPRASSSPSQNVSQEHAPLTEGYTEAQAVSRRGDSVPSILPRSGEPSQHSATQGHGGAREGDAPSPRLCSSKPPECARP